MEALENTINALNQTEAMFDTVFVRCVSQEWLEKDLLEIMKMAWKQYLK